MGSQTIAGYIAHIAFWALLVAGVALGELRRTSTTTFVVLWLVGFWGLPYIQYGTAYFASFVAVLDVALVLLIFKSDIRIR